MSTDFRPGGFNILPEAIKHLIIINGLLFVLTMVLESTVGINLFNYLALHYVGSDYFMPHQIITHMFMHGGMGHVFFNMFALWMFGSVLENVWGMKRFLTYYFLTGIGAAILHSFVTWMSISGLESAVLAYAEAPSLEAFQAFMDDHLAKGGRAYSKFQSVFVQLMDNPSPQLLNQSVGFMQSYVTTMSNVPTVGASGAVFGVLLAFGMLFPNTNIYLYFLFPIKAKYFVLIYGALEFYLGIQNSAGDNVAHFAHLGGMVFGYFIIKYWKKQKRTFY